MAGTAATAGQKGSPLGNPIVVGLLTAVTTVAVAKGASLLADAVMGKPQQTSESLHEDIHRIIDTKLANYRMDPDWLHIPRPPQQAPERQAYPERMPARATGRDAGTHIQEALKHLAQAKDSTNCSYCKKKIDGALGIVSKEIAPVQNALKKQEMIRTLKSRGRLPQGVTWDSMSQDQRDLVDRSLKVA